MHQVCGRFSGRYVMIIDGILYLTPCLTNSRQFDIEQTTGAGTYGYDT